MGVRWYRRGMRLIAGAAVIALLSACTERSSYPPCAERTSTATAGPTTAAATPAPLPCETLRSAHTTATCSVAHRHVRATAAAEFTYEYEEFDVPAGSHPHDVAAHPDGSVWYTGQNVGKMGRLDPATGEIQEVTLPSPGSAPHGVIIGPDNAVWVTDQGANTIERVDPATFDVTTFYMPDNQPVGPHTPTFDAEGILWFTGQGSGTVGRLDPATGQIDIFPAPLDLARTGSTPLQQATSGT